MQKAVAGEDAQAGIGTLSEIAAAVDRDVAEVAAVQAAVGARIGRGDRFEVLVLEAAAQERADAGDALDEIVALVDLAEDLPGAAGQPAIGQARNHGGAVGAVEVLAGLAQADPEAGAELAAVDAVEPAPVGVIGDGRPGGEAGDGNRCQSERTPQASGTTKIEHVAGSPPEQSSRNATRLG